MNEPNDRPAMNLILNENYSMAPEGIKDFRVYVPSSGNLMQMTRFGSKYRFLNLTFLLFPTFWSFQSQNSDCMKAVIEYEEQFTEPLFRLEQLRHRHKLPLILIHLQI